MVSNNFGYYEQGAQGEVRRERRGMGYMGRATHLKWSLFFSFAVIIEVMMWNLNALVMDPSLDLGEAPATRSGNGALGQEKKSGLNDSFVFAARSCV